jgi:hypothetical protein
MASRRFEIGNITPPPELADEPVGELTPRLFCILFLQYISPYLEKVFMDIADVMRDEAAKSRDLLDGTNKRLDILDGRIIVVGQQIAERKGEVNGLTDVLSVKIQSASEQSATKADEIEKRLSARIDSVDLRLGKEIEIVGKKVDVLDGKVDALDKSVDVLDGKVDVLDKRVDALDKKVDTIADAVGGIAKSVAVLQVKADSSQNWQRDFSVCSIAALVIGFVSIYFSLNNSIQNAVEFQRLKQASELSQQEQPKAK